LFWPKPHNALLDCARFPLSGNRPGTFSPVLTTVDFLQLVEDVVAGPILVPSASLALAVVALGFVVTSIGLPA